MNYKALLLLSIAAICATLEQSCTCSPHLDSVTIDGSSTVYVLSEAIAEEYQKLYKSRVSIGVSGTGGGFKKLCSGRIALIGASRAITEHEKDLCLKNNIKTTEYEIALDAIVIAVNKKNNWVHKISIATLKRLFEPEAEGAIMTWKDLDPRWPSRKIAIFSPGVASGTYDYFTKHVIGKEHASRGDITSSEDDNVLVHGVRSNLDSLGFFSFAYFQENKDDIKALALAAHDDIYRMPTIDSIQNGTYALSRPIYLYVNAEKLSKKEKDFVRFYLENISVLAQEVGFISLSDKAYLP
jgi:phosphate transport system substrate-binding protein